MIKDDYIVITRDMVRLGLRGSKLLVYALVYGFSKDGDSDFHGSSVYVADWCGISKPQALAILKELTDEGLLVKTESYRGIPHYAAADGRKTDRSENQPKGSENRPGWSENRPRTDNIVDNIEINLNRDTLNARAKDDMDLDSNLVQYGVKVRMTADEHAKLVTKFGATDAERLIDILDGYLINNPRKKYASHFRAILSWCVRELADQKTAEQRLANAQQASQRITNVQHPVAPGSGATLRAATDRLRELIENDPKLKQQNGLL